MATPAMRTIEIPGGQRIQVPRDWNDNQIDFAVDAYTKQRPSARTIELDGGERIQVPRDWGDEQIDSHIQSMMDTRMAKSDIPNVADIGRQQRAQIRSVEEERGRPPALLPSISSGLEVAGKGILRNIGIPGTNIDLEHGLQKISGGRIRPLEEAESYYESTRGAAPIIARLAGETAMIAPVANALASGVAKYGLKLARGGAVPRVTAATLAGRGAAGRLAHNALQGSVAGALTGHGEPLEDIVYGAAGGVVADKAARLFGIPVTGIQGINPKAKRLINEGIPVTLGQAAPDTSVGRFVRGAEEAATSNLLLGDLVTEMRGRGTKKLTERAISAGLPPGMRLPAGITKYPAELLEDIGQEFTRRYNKILSPRPPTGSITAAGGATVEDMLRQAVPPNFKESLIRSALSDPDMYLTPDRMRLVSRRIYGSVDFDTMSPRQIFAAQSDLRASARKLLSGATTVEDRSAADAYNRAADIILDGLEAGIPGGPDLQALRGPYRNYINLRRAVDRTRSLGEGMSLRQLIVAAEGAKNKPLADLLKVGRSVLPSSLPDSGTAKRLAQMALAGGAVGAVAGGPEAALTGAAIGAGTLLPGLLAATPMGARVLYGQTRPQQAVARFLRRTAPAAGGILAAD